MVIDTGGKRQQYCMNMKKACFCAVLLLAACTPIEPPPEDSGAAYSVESVGQWEPDLNDGRTVVDRLLLDSINDALQVGTSDPETELPPEYVFNTDPATATFLYVNSPRGMSIHLPYNTDWGNTQYVIPPYYQYDEVSEIQFGPLLYAPDAGLSPAFVLWYGEPRTAEVAEADYEAGFEVSPNDVIVKTIGSGSAVVMQNVQGVCPVPVVEVIGKTYNYVLSSSCEALRRMGGETLTQLEAVAKELRID